MRAMIDDDERATSYSYKLCHHHAMCQHASYRLCHHAPCNGTFSLLAVNRIDANALLERLRY